MLVSFAPVAPAMAFDNTVGSEQYGVTVVEAPAPAPTSVILETAQEVVVAAPPAGPVYAPITGISATGLGGSIIPFAVLGVAGFAGIAALAADSNSTNSTN